MIEAQRHGLLCRRFVGVPCEEGSVDSNIAGVNDHTNPNDGDTDRFDYETFGLQCNWKCKHRYDNHWYRGEDEFNE